MNALSGIRVLRIGSSAGAAYCGKLLHGFGADTCSIAAPGEAAVRADPASEWFETTRDRVAFDWADDRRAARLDALLDGVDVLIDASLPREAARAGLDSAALRERHPRLVVCRITPFGIHGPYRDYAAEDITLYAMSGLMQSTGDPKREPLNSRPRLAQLSAGLHAYSAILLALLRRFGDGLGDFIDLSMHESAMENYEIAIAELLAGGGVARRNGDEHNMVPWRTYPCADGEAAIIGGPIRNWKKAAELFGIAEISERFARADVRMKERQAFEALLKPWLASHTRRELFHIGQRMGLAWSYLASLREALDDPQHAARGFFETRVLADGRRCRMPGAPFRSSVTPWRMPHAMPVPQDPPPAGGGAARPPLQGIRVLDFTHDWAGPHAARLLADFGAEVIKIEYPRRLDGMRGGYAGKVNEHPRMWQLHRNKRSLTLDLQRDDHLQFCRRMAADSDLVIENSRPGVMARLGLGYDVLRGLKEDIVMLSMSAFGASGPYAQYAGYGGSIEAISGLQSLTAYDESSPRFRVREVDAINGIFGSCAALTALWHRRRSGAGQWIDVSETETTCWLIGEFFAQASLDDREPAVIGNRDAEHAPQGCYRCAGEDRWLTISVADDAQWRRLALLIGDEALAADPAYASAEARRARHDDIDARIGAWTGTQDAAAAMRLLQELGIAAGLVCNTRDLAADPHLAAREWFCAIDGTRLPGPPFRLQRGGFELRWRGPDLGRDNDYCRERYGDLALDDLLDEAKLGTAYQ
ncbi:CaiB/BaiF CoA transferase family protein [Solimonas soli]|uniref:CaiB/BaiF CoA transferase family protein n=1 Tax=Solimonas soli TaxID=413479 RepID=UPI0004B81FBD|nr:CoA transferase [Solimonas soli]